MIFTRQPQCNVQIDWANPFNRGMAALFNPVSQVNSVNGALCTVFGTPTKRPEAAFGGIALAVDGTNDAWTSGGAYRGTGADITMFAFARLSSRSTSRSILNTSSSSNAGARIEWSQAVERVVFTKGGVANISAAAGMDLELDVPYFLGVSYTHSTGLVQFYLKNLVTGAVQTSTATNASAWVAGDGTFGYGGGQWAPSATWSGGLGLAGVAMRAMSLGELAAIATSPWQLFRMPSRRRFAPPAAVGGAIIANPIRGAFSPTRGYFS
jgi:hypothetical protein